MTPAEPKLSPQLRELIVTAIGLGFDCFSDADRVPFAMVVDGEEKGLLLSFPPVGRPIDEAHIKMVRKAASEVSKGTRRYVLVWDGYLTIESEKMDAVFAEAGEAGSRRGFLFAQRYRKKTRSKKLEKVGNIIALKPIQNLLKGAKRGT